MRCQWSIVLFSERKTSCPSPDNGQNSHEASNEVKHRDCELLSSSDYGDSNFGWDLR